ncbi:MAG: linear amide C-N hydrolase [Granulosicoccus sp.]
MCSTIIFAAGGRKCLAENYDYLLDHGLIGTNLRGTRKSNGHVAADQSIDWVVRFGSVTFNQFSLEMPVSGMNEAGLAVALMWHEEGYYGNDDKQCRRLSSLQWIQYLLDNFDSIDDVVTSLQTIRPERGPIPLHFILLDSSGNSLMVEFIRGNLVLWKNVKNPILTNSSYDKCLAASENSDGTNDEFLGNSMGRFVHLYKQLKNHKEDEDSAISGFRFLDSVSQSSIKNDAAAFPWKALDNETITAWSIVFDPVKKSIMFKTEQNQTIRKLNLLGIDFGAESDFQIVDINAGVAGDMLPYLEPYSMERNQAILKLSAPAVGLPDEAVAGLAGAVDYLYRERRMS